MFRTVQTGEIVAPPRQTRDEAEADRVADLDEHDRNGAAFPLESRGGRRPHCEEHVGLQGDQRFGECLRPFGAAFRKRKSMRTLRPSDHPSRLSPCRDAARRACVKESGSGAALQHADPPHTVGLLCPRRERPRRRIRDLPSRDSYTILRGAAGERVTA